MAAAKVGLCLLECTRPTLHYLQSKCE